MPPPRPPISTTAILYPPFLALLSLYLACSCFKLLLAPSYFSTDFEVHRNWLAISASPLPWTRWYFDESSPNATLDYPPLFAIFEWVLANGVVRGVLVPFVCATQALWTQSPAAAAASAADWCQILRNETSMMLDLKNGVGYASPVVVLVHRLTVVLSDVVFFLAIVRFLNFWWARLPASSSSEGQSSVRRALYMLFILMVFMAPGFIIVDHIHFQYNGILFGILIWCICFVQEKKYLMGGTTFAALLMFKHLFMYMVPAVFVFLLFEYCYSKKQRRFHFGRFVVLGASVLSVFAPSFLPFVVDLQGAMTLSSVASNFKQILARLFPFERGLTHAYWAPNFWALYNAADKFALIAMKRVLPDRYAQLTKSLNGTQIASLTGGLVGTNQGTHVVLPHIKPLYTIVLSLFFAFAICCVLVYQRRSKNWSKVVTLILCLLHSAFSFFMFGWHVHEKAVLMMLVPLSLMPIVQYCTQGTGANGLRSMRWFFFLSVVGSYSLFPLLFKLPEAPVRNAILAVYVIFLLVISRSFQGDLKIGISSLEMLYLLGLAGLELVTLSFEHKALATFASRYPFVPLMLTSIYCALGVTYAWIRMMIEHVTVTTSGKTSTKNKTE